MYFNALLGPDDHMILSYLVIFCCHMACFPLMLFLGLCGTQACAGACSCLPQHLLLLAVIIWIICNGLVHCLIMHLIYLGSLT
jgi:hypothetical protein